ncbi:H-NS family nucleoid-associated regulatory protein [Anaerobiospirillum succiniciproducens]|uniref:H-NS family nucleoid-associated regulatory protein n=1 Tax=Anaerobiospirillum succiniciproducens TaxID=13335 RepID=UPI00248E931E|nr:hypothetical protein [Anaerobiospirillum succiniciproducens]
MVKKYDTQSALREKSTIHRPIRSADESDRSHANAASRFTLQLEEDHNTEQYARSDATYLGRRNHTGFSSDQTQLTPDNSSRFMDSSVESISSSTNGFSRHASHRHQHLNQPPAISGPSSALNQSADMSSQTTAHTHSAATSSQSSVKAHSAAVSDQSSYRYQTFNNGHVADIEEGADEHHDNSIKLLHLGDIRVSALKSLRNLRAWFKDLSPQDIDDIQLQLERLKVEKINEEQERQRKEYLHQAFVKLYRNDGKEDDYALVDPQSLIEGIAQRIGCVQSTTHTNRFKYRFIDLDGKVCEWTGQGREPKRLKAIMAATGKPKEAFLAKEDTPLHAKDVDHDEISQISALVAKMTLLKRTEDLVHGRDHAADKANQTHRPLL